MELCQKRHFGTGWVTGRTRMRNSSSGVLVLMMGFMGWGLVLLNVNGAVAGPTSRLNGNTNSSSEPEFNANGTLVGVSCDFEEPCSWKWDKGRPGFQLLTGQDVSDARARLADPNYEYSGPHVDARNNSNGKFIYTYIYILSIRSKLNFRIGCKCQPEA